MSQTYTIDASVTLTTQICGECHVVFAMPQAMRDQRLRDHLTWWCPNGHQRHFIGKTAEDKLREQLDREKATATRLRASCDQARAEAEHQAARAAGYKGALTKTKKRISGGACPCCNRSFVDLAQHMKTQHPDYTDESTDG